MELYNLTDLEFSVLNDDWREYDYVKDGVLFTRRIENPRFLNVNPHHFAHRILDAQGVVHYMPCGWIDLRWKVAEGTPHFHTTLAQADGTTKQTYWGDEGEDDLDELVNFCDTFDELADAIFEGEAGIIKIGDATFYVGSEKLDPALAEAIAAGREELEEAGLVRQKTRDEMLREAIKEPAPTGEDGLPEFVVTGPEREIEIVIKAPMGGGKTQTCMLLETMFDRFYHDAEPSPLRMYADDGFNSARPVSPTSDVAAMKKLFDRTRFVITTETVESRRASR